MNLQAALINRGTTRMPSKEGVNSTLVSNPVPIGSTIYGLNERVALFNKNHKLPRAKTDSAPVFRYNI